jgi:hypothetical protein
MRLVLAFLVLLLLVFIFHPHYLHIGASWRF